MAEIGFLDISVAEFISVISFELVASQIFLKSAEQRIQVARGELHAHFEVLHDQALQHANIYEFSALRGLNKQLVQSLGLALALPHCLVESPSAFYFEPDSAQEVKHELS